MTSLTSTRAVAISAALAAAAAFASPALAESAGQAVAQCRAELHRQFAPGSIRSYRVAEISGSARRTRVTLSVTADRRYQFECVANARGEIQSASFDPPRTDRQLAGAR